MNTGANSQTKPKKNRQLNESPLNLSHRRLGTGHSAEYTESSTSARSLLFMRFCVGINPQRMCCINITAADDFKSNGGGK